MTLVFPTATVHVHSGNSRLGIYKFFSAGFFLSDKKTVRTKQNLVGSVSCLHPFISLMPITYYPFALVLSMRSKCSIPTHCMEGNTCPYLELVYQYTMFTTEQSRYQQTGTTSINNRGVK